MPHAPVMLSTTLAVSIRCRDGADRTDAWRALTEFALTRGLCGPASRFIGIRYDDGEPGWSATGRYDACITVSPDRAGALNQLDLSYEPDTSALLRVESLWERGPYLPLDLEEPAPTLPLIEVYQRNPALTAQTPRYSAR